MSKFDEIKQRAEAAPEGPWDADRTQLFLEYCDTPWDIDFERGALDCDAASDMAAFIAAARTDIPLLLRALDLACKELPEEIVSRAVGLNDEDLFPPFVMKLNFNQPDHWLEQAQKELEK